MTEEEIADVFDRVAQDLDFPRIEAVVSGAERRGRRLRHQHRVRLAVCSMLTAAAVIAAVATTGIVPRLSGALNSNSPATGASPTPVQTGTAIPSPTAAAPTPSPTSTGSPTPTGNGAGMTTTQIMDDLKAMLPAGSTVSDIRSLGAGNVDFDYNDGHGAVDFLFSIEPLSFYQTPVISCAKSPATGDEGQRPAGALPMSCAIHTLPDGSMEVDWVEYADSFGFYGYSVAEQRPDGTVVSVQVGNGIIHTLPQVTRAVPPGSFAEWNALVQSPVWHL
jgi:hypothetical protein